MERIRGIGCYGERRLQSRPQEAESSVHMLDSILFIIVLGLHVTQVKPMWQYVILYHLGGDAMPIRLSVQFDVPNVQSPLHPSMQTLPTLGQLLLGIGRSDL